jgi:hypothetical protein
MFRLFDLRNVGAAQQGLFWMEPQHIQYKVRGSRQAALAKRLHEKNIGDAAILKLCPT